jgi:PiT family inorganic phosphate transporter
MKIFGLLTIIMTFTFTFVNGLHDGCNVVATIIASRSSSPRKSLWIAALAEFIGPIVLGTSVAATVASVIKVDGAIVQDKMSLILLFFSAVVGAILWDMFTWWKSIPSSSSHALIGGLLGGGIIAYGFEAVNWDIFLFKVILVLFTSPIIGFVTGFIFLKIVTAITRDLHPRVNNYLKNIQFVSMIALGMSHGSNDAQKSMGIVASVLLVLGYTNGFTIPLWVVLMSAFMISMGLALGGWRLIKAVGKGIFNIKPIHSFSSQLASASTIIVASLIGGPVSTTQIVNSSVMGVGMAERKNAVRWSNIKSILVSWILTIPAAGLVSAVVFFLVKIIISGGGNNGI